MRSLVLSVFTALIFCGGMVASSANEFKNADFGNGLSNWYVEGGSLVYLTRENVEGKKGDPKVTPVVKMELSPFKSDLLMQDISDTSPKKILLSIEALPEKNFSRMSSKDIVSGWQVGIEMFVESVGPFDADFWIQGTAGWALKLFKLDRGHWNRLSASFTPRLPRGISHIEFHAPTGSGTIYLKNPAATYN